MDLAKFIREYEKPAELTFLEEQLHAYVEAIYGAHATATIYCIDQDSVSFDISMNGDNVDSETLSIEEVLEIDKSIVNSDHALVVDIMSRLETAEFPVGNCLTNHAFRVGIPMNVIYELITKENKNETI